MFLLATVEDKVSTLPDEFDRPSAIVIMEKIEIKYCNKVLVNGGLCISFYDFVEIGDAYVYPSEGSAIQHVKFRIIVFRPFIGEIIIGRIAKSDRNGLRVSLDFFDDIVVPPSLLMNPCRFDNTAGEWIWEYSADEESAAIDMRIELGSEVRSHNF
jgi:DNA-directed RNA polymerase III subunit RPC8